MRRDLWGVELEFSILGADGFPALGTAKAIVDELRRDGLSIVTELGSFQIELNPGPWPLSEVGIKHGISELERQVAVLEREVATHGLKLWKEGFAPRVSRSQLSSPAFFTDSTRYRVSSAFFASRRAVVEFEQGEPFVLPGETAVALINEIHVNLQMHCPEDTLKVFNHLNDGGAVLAGRFLRSQTLNERRFANSCTTMTLFEQANGDVAETTRISRVSFFPFRVETPRQYFGLVESFPHVRDHVGTTLDPEGSVYFWVRLRKSPCGLRVEYRPPDMTEDWPTVVKSVLASATSTG